MTQTGINKIDVSKITATAEQKAVQSHASGIRRFIYTKKLTLAGGSVTTGLTVPANSQVIMQALKADDALALTTATHVSLGDASDPDEFIETAEATLAPQNDAVIDWPATPDAIAADTEILLATTNGSGAAAGSGTGSFAYVCVYETFDGLTDF